MQACSCASGGAMFIPETVEKKCNKDVMLESSAADKNKKAPLTESKDSSSKKSSRKVA